MAQHLNLDPSLYVRPEVLEAERRAIFWRTLAISRPRRAPWPSPDSISPTDIAGLGVFAIRGRRRRPARLPQCLPPPRRAPARARHGHLRADPLPLPPLGLRR